MHSRRRLPERHLLHLTNYLMHRGKCRERRIPGDDRSQSAPERTMPTPPAGCLSRPRRRLEGLNKYYGSIILASGQVAAVCSGEFLFRRIDRTQPKGAGRPLDVFQLMGRFEGSHESRATSEMMQLVEDWNRVYAVYASKDWLRTLDALQEFADRYPDDIVAGIYLSRVNRIRPRSTAGQLGGRRSLQ